MGEFASGKWIIALIMYFTVFALIVTAVQQGGEWVGDDYRADANVSGYSIPSNNPFLQDVDCIGTLDTESISCWEYGESNESCSNLEGCTYNPSTFWFDCIGTVNLSYYGFVGSGGGFYGADCSVLTDDNNNYTVCSLLENHDCKLVNYDSFGFETINPLSSNSMGGITQTINFMFTFNGNIGIGAEYRYIFAFFFTWLPFIMLLWSIYMALPFLH